MTSTWPSPHLLSLVKPSSGSNQAHLLLHFHDECAYILGIVDQDQVENIDHGDSNKGSPPNKQFGNLKCNS